MWGCRVDKKLKEDRKENLRQFGCWGLQVDPKVIEARKAKLSASMSASMTKFWDDTVGPDRKRPQPSKPRSKTYATKRAEVDQVWIVKGTMCPSCNTALDRDALAHASVHGGGVYVTYGCPCKVKGKKCGRQSIGDAHVRAEIYKSSKDLRDDQKTSMENNIKAWMVRSVDQFNAAGKAAADLAGKDFSASDISLRSLKDMGPKGASASSQRRKKKKRKQMEESGGG